MQLSPAGLTSFNLPNSFFFINSYSHATYVDHGGVHFTRFSCPQSARRGSLEAPILPSARPCPRRNECRPRKVTKEKKRKRHNPPLSTPPQPLP